MRIAIHQPEHMPRINYFEKMKAVDTYVFLDNVPFRKNYFQNRNRVGNTWLTVPVHLNGHTESTIKDIMIDNSNNWQRKYWGRLEDIYRHSPNFKTYSGELKRIIHTPFKYLVNLNWSLIEFFRSVLGIHTPTLSATSLKVEGNKSELLYNICKKLEADVYLSGPSGRNYLENFDGVKVEYFDYEGPDILALDVIMRGKNE